MTLPDADARAAARETLERFEAEMSHPQHVSEPRCVKCSLRVALTALRQVDQIREITNRYRANRINSMQALAEVLALLTAPPEKAV